MQHKICFFWKVKKITNYFLRLDNSIQLLVEIPILTKNRLKFFEKPYFYIISLLDRKSISCKILQVKKIYQDFHKTFNSCKIFGCNDILARFLHESVLYHKNLARNALVCFEDNLICWQQLTTILNFPFTLKVLEIRTFCAVSSMLIQYRAGIQSLKMR